MAESARQEAALQPPPQPEPSKFRRSSSQVLPLPAKQEPSTERPGVPALHISTLSTILLGWLNPMVRRGFSNSTLTPEDLPGLPEQYHADTVAPRAAEMWRQVSAEYEGKDCRIPLLYIVLWRMWKHDLIPGLLWSLLQGLTPTVIRPVLLRLLIERSASDAHDEDGGRVAAYFVVGLLLTLAAEGVSSAATRVYFADRFGAASVATCASLIHSKSLRVSPEVAGNEKNLMSNDLMRCFDSLKVLCMFPNCVSSMIGGVIVLFITLGAAATSGVFLMALVLFASVHCAKRCAKVEKKSLAAADRRLGLVTRAVDGIKAVKLSAWEEPFLEQISEARRIEVIFARTRRTLYMLGTQMGRCSPVVSGAVSVLTVAVFADDFESGRIFAALTIFQALRLSLTMIPAGLTYLATCGVAARRLESFLLLPEVPGLKRDANPEAAEYAVEVAGTVIRRPPVQSGDGTQAGFEFKLDLKLPRGSVTAVVGSVGSGKTTLLLGLLGELEVRGRCSVSQEHMAYVPQQAFVACGTVKYNVLMGRPFVEATYREALRRSALEPDLALLPHGDATEVGERGVTLSGGQQQRLSIARALYGAPDLLVADDPLAAVDGRVARFLATHFLFDAAQRERGRTVVVALNQLHFLPQCDHVVVLSDGGVAEQGSYHELAADESSVLHGMLVESGALGSGDHDIAAADVEVSGPAADEEPAKPGTSTLVKEETLASGAVGKTVWRTYARGMGYGYCVACGMLSLMSYTAMGASDRWLAAWLEDDDANNRDYAPLYAAFVVLMAVLMGLSTVVYSTATAKAGRRLHDDCSRALFRAPVQWFEATPSGRILSRFSSDLSAVDNTMTYFIENTVGMFATLLVLVAVLCWIVPPVLAVLPVAMPLFGVQLLASDRCNRALRRLANTAMAPVLTSLAEVSSPQGRPLVRAMSLYGNCWGRFARGVDELNRRNFLSNAVVAWQTLWSYAISFLVSVVASIWVLWGPADTPDARVGLALTYSFLMPYFILYSAFCYSVLSISVTALERLLECSHLPQEPEWFVAPGPPAEWPAHGSIDFENAVLRYRPDLPPSLKDVSLHIPGGSKVGIVGRTGAGKSSLVTLLFRLVESSGGRVCIDGVSIASIGVQQLRRVMAIIPQEPLLLSGTVRENLDPFSQSTDDVLARALQQVGAVDLNLDTPVGLGAQGLSSGQRQLVSLARTLVRQCRIVVMDEPTSNVDPATDLAVQRALRENFSGRTVLTIAHRLPTVAEADIIVVMDAGRVAESGSPAKLLSLPQGQFASMVADMGQAAAASLRKQVERRAM